MLSSSTPKISKISKIPKIPKITLMDIAITTGHLLLFGWFFLLIYGFYWVTIKLEVKDYFCSYDIAPTFNII